MNRFYFTLFSIYENICLKLNTTIIIKFIHTLVENRQDKPQNKTRQKKSVSMQMSCCCMGMSFSYIDAASVLLLLVDARVQYNTNIVRRVCILKLILIFRLLSTWNHGNALFLSFHRDRRHNHQRHRYCILCFSIILFVFNSKWICVVYCNEINKVCL